MDGYARGAVAVAVGYLLAFYVADANNQVRMSWATLAIGASGALAAAAGFRALPIRGRLILGVASTAGFAILSVIGLPVTVGLFLGVALVGGGTMSLFDAHHENASGDSAER